MKKIAFTLVLFFTFSTSARAELLSGTYVVPASTDGSFPSQSYPLDGLSITEDSDGNRTLSFSLPEDLVGPEVAPIILSGPPAGAGSLLFDGTGVYAYCVDQAGSNRVECTLTYSPGYLKVDPNSVSNFLSQRYADQPSIIREKQASSARFLGDPEGTVEISLAH
jgi:hypothetical protein